MPAKKRCNCCNRTKPIDDFQTRDGVTSGRCKPCDEARESGESFDLSDHPIDSDGMSVAEVAIAMGISRQAVHQIEERALRKLRGLRHLLRGFS